MSDLLAQGAMLARAVAKGAGALGLGSKRNLGFEGDVGHGGVMRLLVAAVHAHTKSLIIPE